MRIKNQISIASLLMLFFFGHMLTGHLFAFQSQMEVRQSGEYDAKEFAQSKPAVGEFAPDIELKTLDGETVTLDSYRGKNIVVIKAGYPSPLIRRAAAGLRQLHQQYVASSVASKSIADKNSGAAKPAEPDTEIIIVYQKEPHAGELAFNDLAQPESFEQRCELAQKMRDEYELPMTVLVDTVEDQSRALFSDLPSPTFVIDAEGVIRDKFPWADAEAVKSAVAKLGTVKRKKKRGNPAIWLGVLIPLFVIFIVIFSQSNKHTTYGVADEITEK